MAILGDKARGTFAEREAASRDVMARGFDVPLVARFVLGRHWKAATKEQRAVFTSILLDFLARVYTPRFDSYSYGGERFTVRCAIADESSDTVVRAQVVRSSGAEPVGLDFRVRWKNGTPRVIDLHVEGIGGLLSDIRALIETPIEDAAARRRSTRSVPRRRSTDFATAGVRSGACS